MRRLSNSKALQRSVALLGVPYDFSSSYLRGPAAAPDAIRAAFLCDSANTFSEQCVDLRDAFNDLGDIALEEEEPNAAFTVIEAAAVSALARHDRLLVLGGDHSVSLPVLRALKDVHRDGVNVLHFDAHPDMTSQGCISSLS